LELKKSKFSEDQIVKILTEAAKGDKTVAEVCRAHGASQNTYYLWKRKYSGVQTDDLKRLRELERENSQLKRIVADMALEIDTVKGVMRKNGMALPSDARERNS
jgi:putative transposase